MVVWSYFYQRNFKELFLMSEEGITAGQMTVARCTRDSP